jgi:hypothetical protein
MSRIRNGSLCDWPGKFPGPPALTILPPYVFHAYNLTPSLFICAVAFILLWRLAKNPPWLLGAWLLHILRYPDARGDLLPNTFPLAPSYVIRERHSLVYAMVYDRQLHEHDRRLC